MASKEMMVYDLIERKAGSNTLMQGISGALGFPFTLIADVGVVFTHYGPMMNEIRRIYGRDELEYKDMIPVVKACNKEIIADLVADKIVGNFPLLGIGANMLCAKAMTWRLGILFGMLAARGDEMNTENAKAALVLIRELFPQSKSVGFQKPSAVITEKLLQSVKDVSTKTFNQRVLDVLNACTA